MEAAMSNRFLIIICILLSSSLFGAMNSDTSSQRSLRAGVVVRFVDLQENIRFGTIREISGASFQIVTLDGKAERFNTEEIVSYESSGEKKEIKPAWSSGTITKLIYNLVLTGGRTVSGGWLGNPVWWIDLPDGQVVRNGGSGFISIEAADQLPPVAPPPAPVDLDKYRYLEQESRTLRVYLDELGRGVIFDMKRNKWIRIPDFDRVQPAYTKTSDTMVLFYGIGSAAVYDIELGQFIPLPRLQGRAFSGFSRTATRDYAAQCNDKLALAAGTVWCSVYDQSLHRWISLEGGADDSTDSLPLNLLLEENSASIKILNGRIMRYLLGSGRFR